MRALRLATLMEGFAGCGVEEIGIPEPGSGEVRIRVASAAITFVDLLMTTGGYQTKPPLPFTLGSDVSGTIDAVGEGVETFAPGEAVVGMRMGGAFAEQVVMSLDAVRPKPETFSFDQGAAYGAAYYTAFHALTRRGGVRPGDWVLVHGATGGVGLAAVDLGRALDLRIIAASTSEAKLKVLEQTYRPAATLVIKDRFRDEVKAQTNGQGVAAVFDPVGGSLFTESTRCLAFDGRYLVVGFTSGEIPQISVNVPLIKGFSIMGVRAGEYGRRFPERGAEDRRALWNLAQSGAISPHVHATFPLEDWRSAFAMMRDRKVVGRVVLHPAGPTP